MGSTYIHGTEPEEQRRLSTLNDLINDGSLQRLDLRGGERVLDVGSGLGQLSRRMARAVGPGGRVVGVERSDEQRAEAEKLAAAAGEDGRVEFRRGEADRLPLRDDEWGTFDVVHARFLLEHVPDPAAVVTSMVRAARPGGRIVLEDDDHEMLRAWPEPPGLVRAWQAYMKVFRGLGCDPIVGRRLVELLHGAGARPCRNDWLFFGCCAGEDRFGMFVRNLAGVLESAAKDLTAPGLLGPGELDEVLRALEEWGKRPDAALWYARAWAEGVRRSEATAT